MDIFSIYRHKKKLNQQEASKVEIQKKLIETEQTLKDLRYLSGKEKYAREKKYFKKDDEDIFVLSYE
jgi:hypothetical protein